MRYDVSAERKALLAWYSGLVMTTVSSNAYTYGPPMEGQMNRCAGTLQASIFLILIRNLTACEKKQQENMNRMLVWRLNNG